MTSHIKELIDSKYSELTQPRGVSDKVHNAIRGCNVGNSMCPDEHSSICGMPNNPSPSEEETTNKPIRLLNNIMSPFEMFWDSEILAEGARILNILHSRPLDSSIEHYTFIDEWREYVTALKVKFREQSHGISMKISLLFPDDVHIDKIVHHKTRGCYTGGYMCKSTHAIHCPHKIGDSPAPSVELDDYYQRCRLVDIVSGEAMCASAELLDEGYRIVNILNSREASFVPDRETFIREWNEYKETVVAMYPIVDA